jgi:hypothetical protein
VTVAGAAVGGAGSGIRIEGTGAISLGASSLTKAAAQDLILLSGSSFQLTGAVNAGAGDVVLVEKALPGGGSNPFELNDDTVVKRVTANSLNLVAGSRDGSVGTVIGNVTYTAGLRQIRVYAGSGAKVEIKGVVVDGASSGAASTLTVGTFEGTGDAATPRFGGGVIDNRWTPSIVRISGSIGGDAAVAGQRALQTVRLSGDAIYIAPPDSTFDIEKAPKGTDNLDLLGGSSYTGSAATTVQVRAQTLELRANDRILQRNLDRAGGSSGRGLIVGSLFVGSVKSGGTPHPSQVNLYGQLQSTQPAKLPAQGPVSGPDYVDGLSAALLLKVGPAGNVPYTLNGLDLNRYRINNCTFSGGGCFVTPPPQSVPSLPKPDDVGDVADRFAPVNDEPVTSVGGEFEWRLSSPSDREEK